MIAEPTVSCDCGAAATRLSSRRDILRIETINARSRVTAIVLASDAVDAAAVCEALAKRSIDSQAHADALVGLYEIGASFPDIVVVGPIDGPFSQIDVVRTIRSREPQLSLIAGVDLAHGSVAAEALGAGAGAVVAWPPNAEALADMMRSMAATSAHDLGQPAIDLGRLRIDGTTPQIWLDGERLELTPKEFDLLRYLATHVGLVVRRDELLAKVWGTTSTPASNTLTVHIRRLRTHLNDSDSEPSWIRAFRGRGYQLSVPAE